jgi:NAD+ synthase (glutamine-hydrolysing)
MKDGFIKVAAGTLHVTVADVEKNTEEIKKRISDADKAGVNLLVLPELCMTGYTCGDLFYSEVLLNAAKKALTDISSYMKGKYPVVVIGLPIQYEYKLFNCAAVLHDGEVLALVPKTHLPNYNEFYEKRQFTSALALKGKNTFINIDGKQIPFGCGILFQHSEMESFKFGVELCEDLWAPEPPSSTLCKSGAVIIANPSPPTKSSVKTTTAGCW